MDLLTRLSEAGLPLNSIILNGLFNGQLLFVLKFLAGVMLVFIIGGLFGRILHLENAYKSDTPSDINLNNDHNDNEKI